MRRRPRRAWALGAAGALAAFAMAGPAVSPAPAQVGGPFAPLPPAAPATPTQTTDTTATTTAASDSGLSAGMQVLIFGGAAALLGGIAVVIIRDARSRAPEAAHSLPPRSGSAAKPDRARARSKAKAARAQRRRNR